MSDDLLPSNGLENLSDEEIESAILDRPIASIRDLQYTYGSLTMLALAGGGDYAKFYTPEEATGLLNEPQSLIVVQVDFTGEEPEYKGVNVRQYTSDIVDDVGLSRYPPGAAVDHSVAHRSGNDKEPEKLAKYAYERLTRWPTEEPVQEVAEEHPDGHLITGLDDIAESVKDDIKEDVLERIEEKSTSIATIAVKRDEDVGWEYSGEVDVYNEAMARRKSSKYTSKNEASDSQGEAVDFVTENEATVVGTPEDPVHFYATKQVEKFPDHDPDAAWMTHPISGGTASTIEKSSIITGALSDTVFGLSVYYLPYFTGTMDADDARSLYRMLTGIVAEQDNDDENPLTMAYEYLRDNKDDLFDRLCFHVLVVQKPHHTRWNVFHERTNARGISARDIADAHVSVLKSWLFSPYGSDGPSLFTEVEHDDEDRVTLLNPNADYTGLVASGGYLGQTIPYPEHDDIEIGHPSYELFSNLVSGQSVRVDTLLSLFVENLCEEYWTEGNRAWQNQVISQWAQLMALASRSQLETRSTALEPFTDAPRYMTTDENETPETAEEMLAQFIDDHPPLREDSERRSAFLLGALIGKLSNYQYRERDIEHTLADSHPMSNLTTSNFKRILSEAVEKSQVYASAADKNLGPRLYSPIVDRLVDDAQQSDPREWGISRDDLRYHYALGIAFGQNQYTGASASGDDADESEDK